MSSDGASEKRQRPALPAPSLRQAFEGCHRRVLAGDPAAEHDDTVVVFSHGGVINVVLHELSMEI